MAYHLTIVFNSPTLQISKKHLNLFLKMKYLEPKQNSDQIFRTKINEYLTCSLIEPINSCQQLIRVNTIIHSMH